MYTHSSLLEYSFMARMKALLLAEVIQTDGLLSPSTKSAQTATSFAEMNLKN